jgi:RHS repeat-associated protein
LLSETWSGTINGTVSRTYNNDFRVTSRSVNGANTASFAYDADSLLTAAGSATLTRDPDNGLLMGTSLGVVTDGYTYNGFGEVATYEADVSGTPIYSVTYPRDNLGRIAQKVETVEGVTSTYEYGYDTAGRLTDVATNGTATAHYDYDANGNRTGGFNVAGTISNTQYDDQDRLVAWSLGLEAFSCSYTANGELLTKTDTTSTTTYNYDALGTLLSVSLPSGDLIEYVVDGRGGRVGKKVNGALTQGFLYDGQLRIVAELDGSSNVVSRFVYGDKVNVPEYMVRGGTTYRIVTDQLGSPRLVINTTDGNIAQRLDFDGFGNVTVDSNPGFQPFGFAGGLYDRDTKLVRFGERDYDVEAGRWTDKDPLAFAGGDTNLYSYALADPIDFTDPAGTQIAVPLPVVLLPLRALYCALNPDVCAQLLRDLINSLNNMESRGNSDPIQNLQPFNPGRDCDGNCNPCPSNSYWPAPGSAHGSTTGSHWHGIEWNQAPDCTCHPKRVSGAGTMP